MTLPQTRLHAVAALSLALVSGVALANDTGDERETQNDDHFSIGIGAGYAPAYLGAEDYRAIPVPAIDLKWGPLFANLGNGVGFNLIDSRHLTAGVGVTYVPGYRRRDTPEGIGGLSGGVGGRAFVSIKALGAIATVGGTRVLTGAGDGIVADASLSYPIAITPRFMLIPTVGARWADADYNNRYFGVDAAQSLASGLAPFQPGEGIRDQFAMLSVSYALTNHIAIGLSGGVTTLGDTVVDSPLVFHRTQPSGFASLSYRFGS